jgi:hypothetical protein
LVNGKVIQYLSGYCRKEKCTIEEAKTHAIVRSVIDMYEHENDGKVLPSEDVQCECEMEDKSC